MTPEGFLRSGGATLVMRQRTPSIFVDAEENPAPGWIFRYTEGGFVKGRPIGVHRTDSYALNETDPIVWCRSIRGDTCRLVRAITVTISIPVPSVIFDARPIPVQPEEQAT